MEGEMSEGLKSSPWLISFEDPVGDNTHTPTIVEGCNKYKGLDLMTDTSVSVGRPSIHPNNATEI